MALSFNFKKSGASLDISSILYLDFVATKSGTFPFYCSVSCSSSDNPSFDLENGEVQTGTYAGTVRGHFEHVGEFIVNAIKELVGGN
mgnify:CR=1 FL=1